MSTDDLSGWCVDPREIKAADDFVRGFEARYGNAPGTLVPEMYDVTTFVTKALERFDEDTPIRTIRRGIIRYFDRGVDLVGVTKAFSWTEDGELVTNSAQDVWIYEWNLKTDNLEAVGPVGDLL